MERDNRRFITFLSLPFPSLTFRLDGYGLVRTRLYFAATLVFLPRRGVPVAASSLMLGQVWKDGVTASMENETRVARSRQEC